MRIESLVRDYKRILGIKQHLPKKLIFKKDTSLEFVWDNNRRFNLPNNSLPLRWYQQSVHDAIFKDKKRFVYLAWSRRCGKELVSWTAMLKFLLLHPKTDGAFIYPTITQGKHVIWPGNITVGDRGITYFDFLPPFVDRIDDINNTTRCITFPNGSRLFVEGSKSYDALRGTNLRICVFSEYAFQDPNALRNIFPMFAQNKGTIIIQSTFDGKNHGWDMWEKVKNDADWYSSFLTVETCVDENGKRYIDEEEINIQRRTGQVSESKIQQEYYMSVEGDENRYYFANVMKDLRAENRVRPNLPQPGYTVTACWDIGSSVDSNYIILVQFINNEIHIIKSFETSGKTYEYEINMVSVWLERKNLALNQHILPHDGKNRLKVTRAGTESQSPLEHIIRDLGKPCRAVNKPKTLREGVQLVRSMLPFMNIDSENCSGLIECLDQHSKTMNEEKRIYEPTRHDWTSNGVKAIQTLCLAIQDGLLKPLNRDMLSYARSSDDFMMDDNVHQLRPTAANY